MRFASQMIVGVANKRNRSQGKVIEMRKINDKERSPIQ